MTVPEARAMGFKALTGMTDTAALDCRILLCHVLKMTQSELLLSTRQLSAEEEKCFEGLLKKRAEGFSVAVVIGHKEFFGRDFIVNDKVLVPRPETEILVERVINEFKDRHQNPLKALDICTGSGCIGITVLAELERIGIDCEMILSDVCEQALGIAEDNCRQIIENRSKCILSDVFEAFDGRRFNLITANPPYIAPAMKDSLATEVLHEPELALFADDGGFALIRRIISESPKHLSNGGLLILECGYDQADETRKLMDESGFASSFILKDLAGLPRCVGGYANA